MKRKLNLLKEIKKAEREYSRGELLSFEEVVARIEKKVKRRKAKTKKTS